MRSEIIRGRGGRREKIVQVETPEDLAAVPRRSDVWKFVVIGALLAGLAVFWLCR